MASCKDSSLLEPRSTKLTVSTVSFSPVAGPISVAPNGPAPNYALSPAWRIELGENSARCIGGPDEAHVITELDAPTLDTLQNWVRRGSAKPSEGETGDLAQLRAFLTAIGVLVPSERSSTQLEWVTVGPIAPTEAIRLAMAPFLPAGVGALTILLRSGGTLAELSRHALALRTSHVLIDLTGHHTLSIGPFVTPPLTACVGCYAGRLAERWGDDHPSPEPASQRWIGLTADLTCIQLELIARGNSPLVNGTINWDLRSGQSRRDDLLRYSACESCQQGSGGAVSLPWGPRLSPHDSARRDRR